MPIEASQRVVQVSIHWLLTIQREAGVDAGMKCYDVFRSTFGEDLAGAVLFGILEGNKPFIEIRIIPHKVWNKIDTIKKVRAISGLGLGEAKALVESKVDEWIQIPISSDSDSMPVDKIQSAITSFISYGVEAR